MSRRTSSRSGSTVDVEVANLFKLQNKSQFTNALLALRQRYNDEDLVNKIQEVFMERHSSIVKSAKKFAIAVREKYAQQNVPFHQLLMKARAHAKKHRLSEAEFTEFQRIYEQELSGTNSSEFAIPMTSIMKVLGNITSGSQGYFKVDEPDYRNLQEILKLHDASRALHSQVLLQSIQYDMVSTFYQDIEFKPELQNPADHIHPIIAALFVPKIKCIDEHFLYSNMSGIVKARYNHTPLSTRPDYELFYNLVTDPNDVVCDTRSPVGDLLHRCNLQNQLWNSVLHLRNGQLFNPSLREFVSAVDVCRLNKYDNPDLVYGRHDGTILKRLFSAFSFRPTTVATLPIASLFAYNPYSQNMRPTITAIPMINVRLANFNISSIPTATLNPTATTEISLSNSLIQSNDFLEGNAVVRRHTNVMFSREILVFYVDRRSYLYNSTDIMTNMTRLPTSIAGFERINKTKLNFESEIKLPDSTDTFKLVSAVIAETNDKIDPANNGNYVIGSSTYIFEATATATHCLHYNPTNMFGDRKPVTVGTVVSTRITKAFTSVATTEVKTPIEQTGIIYIYAKSS